MWREACRNDPRFYVPISLEAKYSPDTYEVKATFCDKLAMALDLGFWLKISIVLAYPDGRTDTDEDHDYLSLLCKYLPQIMPLVVAMSIQESEPAWVVIDQALQLCSAPVLRSLELLHCQSLEGGHLGEGSPQNRPVVSPNLFDGNAPFLRLLGWDAFGITSRCR